MGFKREPNPLQSLVVASASRLLWIPCLTTHTPRASFPSRGLSAHPAPGLEQPSPGPALAATSSHSHLCSGSPPASENPFLSSRAVTSGSQPMPSHRLMESPCPMTCVLVYSLSAHCDASHVRAGCHPPGRCLSHSSWKSAGTTCWLRKWIT